MLHSRTGFASFRRRRLIAHRKRFSAAASFCSLNMPQTTAANIKISKTVCNSMDKVIFKPPEHLFVFILYPVKSIMSSTFFGYAVIIFRWLYHKRDFAQKIFRYIYFIQYVAFLERYHTTNLIAVYYDWLFTQKNLENIYRLRHKFLYNKACKS